MTVLIIWGLALALYAIFWVWYVGFKKPVSPAEIEDLVSVLAARGVAPERLQIFRDFFATDSGGEFVMVNSLLLAEPKDRARSNLQSYSKSFMGELLKRAGHPIFQGKAVGANIEQWGIETGPWDLAALVRYRSRRDLLEMLLFAIGDVHQFKIKALEKTFAYPVEPLMQSGNLRVLVALFLALAAAFANLSYLVGLN